MNKSWGILNCIVCPIIIAYKINDLVMQRGLVEDAYFIITLMVISLLKSIAGLMRGQSNA